MKIHSTIYPKISYKISTIFLVNKDYSNSLIYSEEVIQCCINENNFIYLPYLYYHSMLKNYNKAKEYLDNCKSIFKLQNNLEEYQRVYHADYQLYFSNGDFAI